MRNRSRALDRYEIPDRQREKVWNDDDGSVWILFGVWDYYIARMSDDLFSVADTPRRIDVIEPRFLASTWPHGPTQGRHGSSFAWRGRWFFTYCEMCFSGNRYYRDFWISDVHYRDDGRTEPIRITSEAVSIG